MSDAGFFRGTSAEQDNRFSDKEKKLLKQMRFSDSILKKVDMSKVKLEVLKPWISKRISELLGMEDDVLVEFVFNQLEAESFPDARRIQINLTGFLNGKNARIFTGELWDMLLSAQDTSFGIPGSIIESKKEEIKKRNEEQEKINETLKKTVSRFNDRLRKDRDSPPRRDRRSDSRDKSRSRSRSRSKEREKGTRGPIKTEVESDAETPASELKKKDDSVQAKRHYRTRHSSSASPDQSKRKSRSTSPSRENARDKRDSRNKNQKDLMDEIKAERDREKDKPDRHEAPRYDRGDRDRDRNWRDRERMDWGDRRNRDRSKRSRSRGSRSRSPQQDRFRRRPPHFYQQSNTRGYGMDRGRRDLGNDHSMYRGPQPDFRSKSPDRSYKDNRYSFASNSDRRSSQGRSTLHSVFNSGHSSDVRKGRQSRSKSPEIRKAFTPDRSRRSGSISSSRSPSPNQRQSSRSKPKHNNEKENSTISMDKIKDSTAKLDSRPSESSLLKKRKEKDSVQSPRSSSGEDVSVSRKKKKKEKKHKKHKKHKKQKKSKRSESDDDDDDDDASGDEEIVSSGGSRIASTFLKLVEPAAISHSEDLEKTLREKALESMKKAAAAGRE